MQSGHRRSPQDVLASCNPREICILKPSSLGDVVQSLPVLSALRERFPEARISWVIARELSDLLEGHPFLDRVIRFDRRGGPVSWWRLLRRLRQARFDLVFDLQGLLRTAVMSWATGARMRVGLETAREGAGLACHLTLPDSGRGVPAVLRYWRVAEAVGMGHLACRPFLPIRPFDQQAARRLAEELGRPILAVHAGARWPTKRWPVERFAAVASKALRRYGLAAVLLGTAQDEPRAARLERLIGRFVRTAPVVNLVGQTSLMRLAALLEQAVVLLTNDSGPMHLAGAVGTPVVGIFTCTSARLSAPPGEGHELVSSRLSCAAGYHKRCPFRGRRHLACHDEVSIDDVWPRLVRLVERQGRFRRAA